MSCVNIVETTVYTAYSNSIMCTRGWISSDSTLAKLGPAAAYDLHDDIGIFPLNRCSHLALSRRVSSLGSFNNTSVFSHELEKRPMNGNVHRAYIGMMTSQTYRIHDIL